MLSPRLYITLIVMRRMLHRNENRISIAKEDSKKLKQDIAL